MALVPFMSMRDRAGARGARGHDACASSRSSRGCRRRATTPRRSRTWPTPALLAALAAEWPLGANLDLHVQRARAVARNWHPDVESLSLDPRLRASGRCPSRPRSPGSSRSSSTRSTTSSRTASTSRPALVVGPRGEREVIEITDGPPTEESEAELVETWVTRLLDAVREVADGETLYLHVYVYDTYDQKVVLEAIRRNLDRLAGLARLLRPAHRDRGDVAVDVQLPRAGGARAEEPRHPLPLAAARRRAGCGSTGTFEGVELHRVFQARVFDNRRTLPDERWYESASRFNSQIPLEYAYGAWGRLPDRRRRRRDGSSIRSASRSTSCCSSRARGSALSRTSSESFRVRNRFAPKEPITLPSRRGVGGHEIASRRRAPRVPLRRAPHEAPGTALALLAAGRAARRERLVAAARGARGRRGAAVCRFRIRFDLAGLDPAPALQQMGPEEGDWMVIGPANDAAKPWEILRGRIAIVQSIDGDEIDRRADADVVREERLPLRPQRSSWRSRRGSCTCSTRWPTTSSPSGCSTAAGTPATTTSSSGSRRARPSRRARVVPTGEEASLRDVPRGARGRPTGSSRRPSVRAR